MILKDVEILEKLKKGDHSGYKELFDRYYIALSTYSLKYCDSFQLAEDIVQEIFVKFWDEKLYLKMDKAISPYLFKAVKNNTLQVMKKKSKHYVEPIENHVHKLMEDEQFDLDGLQEEKKKLFEEIEILPEKCKEVFKAIVLGDLKYKEVAEELGISVNTVKTQYSIALKKLRKPLDLITVLLLV